LVVYSAHVEEDEQSQFARQIEEEVLAVSPCESTSDEEATKKQSNAKGQRELPNQPQNRTPH
jgi:hypothetical protein